MNEVSDYIYQRAGKANSDQFEGALYDELTKRLGTVRKTTGLQIGLSSWKAWLLPILTVLAIVCVYLFWIVPQY